MDFSGVTTDTANEVALAIDRILRMNISPAARQERIAKVLRAVGVHFHGQLYAAASKVFDAAIIASAGLSSADAQEERLANKLVRNYVLGRTSAGLVYEYYNSVLGKAQDEAFSNAKSMQKHPTLTRTLGPKKDCQWCIEKEGTHVNPQSEDFRRHRECDCLFVVSGYNSRNGRLENYTKDDRRRIGP